LIPGALLVSRLVDALRNLQQPAETPASESTQKVTPRLAASIRRAVLGDQPHQPEATSQQPQVLFRVPDASSPPAEPIQEATSAEQDPLSLMDSIEASVREAAHDEQKPVAVAVATMISASPVITPATSVRSGPTNGEQEIFALLADATRSAPYRNLVQAVKRDTSTIVSPIIAIVGIDECDATGFVAASLASLLVEQASRSLLLVEANPHQRRLAALYGARQAVGLCESIAGRCEESGVILRTSLERLNLLPFGQASTAEAQLLPQGLPSEIRRLHLRHGAMVLDAGPLTSAWALAASQAADAVYLLIRLGDTAAEYAATSVNRFRTAGGKLTACVAMNGQG